MSGKGTAWKVIPGRLCAHFDMYSAHAILGLHALNTWKKGKEL